MLRCQRSGGCWVAAARRRATSVALELSLSVPSALYRVQLADYDDGDVALVAVGAVEANVGAERMRFDGARSSSLCAVR